MRIKNLAVAVLASMYLVSANAAAPLLQDGKKSLYKRVLTTPSCVLKKNVADKDGKSIDAFSRFYVYKEDGHSILVGSDTSGSNLLYLKKSCTVDWKMQTALMFNNPANRTRSIIFKDQETLNTLVEKDDAKADVAKLLKDIQSKKANKSVVSVEPETYVDYKKQFYLLPILDYSEAMFADGNNVNVLKIASITKKGDAKSQNGDGNALKTFKAAVVFVIDSTISMDPYIERTKSTIQSISRKIEKEHLQNSVNFGLVSFRSSTKATPKLEYVTKVFVKPGEAKTAAEFEKKLATLSQAKVSSAAYAEDSIAGVNTALDKIDWKDYGGRYVVLITDASGIKGTDKLSSTGLDTKELRLEAKHKGVAIYTMHLLTPSGERNKDHDRAREQYQDLSFNDTINKPLYYSVNAGDVNEFGKKIDALSSSITEQVKQASFGKDAIGYNPGSDDTEIQSDLQKLGHAMQLAYLGSTLSSKSPDFFEGWIADRDLLSHGVPTSTPVVLVTKDELSSLKDVTKNILDSANQGMLEPEAMFEQLRSVAVSMGRDPSQISNSKTLKLGQLGLLGEFLEDLPYKSRIQDLDEDTWAAMGPDEQNQTIEDLENKLNYYQKCNDDVSRWIKLNKDDDASMAVYPIPLEVLP